MKNLVGFLGLLSLCAAAQAATVRVDISGMKFVPQHVDIKAGDTVEFVNTTSFKHTVTADPSLVRDPANVVLPMGAMPFHSGVLAPSGTFTQTFTVAGDYRYVCLPHERMGMMGSITVAD